jgi:transcription elongation factor Elf1
MMVYYRHIHGVAQLPPPICPKCGSHRTQVVGRSNDAKKVVVRCSSCGERSDVVIDRPKDGEDRVARPIDAAV